MSIERYFRVSIYIEGRSVYDSARKRTLFAITVSRVFPNVLSSKIRR
jgi:hypothetical protein